MNKTIAIIIVLVVCILFIGGISAMAVNSSGDGWHFDLNFDWLNFGAFSGERADVDENAGFSTEGITAVEVYLPFGNVNVEVGEPGAALKGHFNVTEKKRQYLYVSNESGKLSIKFDPGTLPLTQDSNVVMTVRLPRELAANLRITNSSGDMHITGLKVQDLKVSNSSGNMDIVGCSGGKLEADLSSGNITVTGGDFTSVDADCSSGNVRVENLNGPINVQDTSGNINISAVSGTVYANNSSGNIDIVMSGKQVSDITAELSSGNVNLFLDPQAAFTLDARTSSGNVSCNFAILVSGGTNDNEKLEGTVNGGGAAVKLSTSSGNVTVMKK